jgi:hypothetical protein
MDNGDRIDAIVVSFLKAFDLVPHDRLLMKIAISSVDSRVAAWIREFLLDRTQKFRVGGHLSEDGKITSGVPQGTVLGPLLFIAYVDDIWRNIASTIRLYADDCVIYKKINNEDIEILQKDLDRLGEWAAQNAIKINPSKCRAFCFTRARVKDPLNYTLGDQLIPESSSCKYLGIILRSDLS